VINIKEPVFGDEDFATPGEKRKAEKAKTYK